MFSGVGGGTLVTDVSGSASRGGQSVPGSRGSPVEPFIANEEGPHRYAAGSFLFLVHHKGN